MTQGPSRFVILSNSRSGSNLLVSLLSSHGQVQCEGEVLNDFQAERIIWRDRRPTDPTDLALRESDPIRFLETKVFAPESDDVRSCGFKIFYQHGQREAWQCVWPYLQGMPDLRVIHLVREDQLARVLSNHVAQETKRWFIRDAAEAHHDLRVTLDVEACRAEFERGAQWHQRRAALFAAHDVLPLTYEQLADDMPDQCDRILRYLGVELRPLSTPLVKQLRQSPAETIANYDELRAAFLGSPWEGLFR